MRYTIVIVLLLFVLFNSPVTNALSFGVTPSVVNIEIPSNGQANTEFVISGYEGIVIIGLEGLSGFTIIPTETIVTDGKINSCIYSNISPIGNYEGKILISTTGGNVNLGVKVVAYIIVVPSNNVSLSATVLSSSSSGGSYYGGGYRYVEPDYSSTTTPTVLTVTVPPIIPVPPDYIPPPSEPLPQVTPAVGVPMPTKQGTIHIGWFLIGGGILIIGFIVWYLWSKRRKPKKLEPSQPV